MGAIGMLDACLLGLSDEAAAAAAAEAAEGVLVLGCGDESERGMPVAGFQASRAAGDTGHEEAGEEDAAGRREEGGGTVCMCVERGEGEVGMEAHGGEHGGAWRRTLRRKKVHEANVACS